MRWSFACAALFVAAMTAAPAMAQEPCRSGPVDGAKAVEMTGPTAMAAAIVAGAALTPEAIGDLDRAVRCIHGAPFRSGSYEYVITGENGDAHPRRILPTQRGGAVFFLTPTLNPATLGPGDSEFALLLVRMDSRGAFGLRVYDGMPSTELLIRDVEASLLERLTPFAGMLAGSKSLTVFTGAAANRPEVARPAPRQISSADGVVFHADASGGVRHARTGFVCPEDLRGHRRRGMTIYDPSEGGRDVGCFYDEGSGNATYSIYLTTVDPRDHKENFRQTVAALQSMREGRVANVRSPVRTGRAPRPADAAFWERAPGTIDGVAISPIGEWSFKLRITYRSGAEEEVDQVAATVFESANQAIQPSRR